MISVADLLVNNRIPGNFYATDTYVKSDLEMGLLETRRGDRLLALPETLIQAIYTGLERETGQASYLVLQNCGRWWGKTFYTRFREELTEYYGTSLAEMSMADFLKSLQSCWITYGWGRIEMDYSHSQQGLLLIKTWNSPFAKQFRNSDRPVCFLEMGILTAFFSQLTGKDLRCVQTACESLGADCNQFIIGLAKRMGTVDGMVEKRLDHNTILHSLCS
jgi:predicted hydrocarbon binding protein